jgi:tetratricopeptide (TPR) repeat protein
LTALQITPSSPSAFAAWNALQTLLSPAELDALLPRLQRLSDLYPQIAEAQFCYGLALLSQALASNHPERLDTAQTVLERAIHLKPRLAEAHLALGNLYVARKENQKAAEAFLETIRLDPHSEMAFYRLGQTYRNLNQLEQAQKQLSRYAELVRNRREQMARSRSAIKQFVLAQSAKESQ